MVDYPRRCIFNSNLNMNLDKVQDDLLMTLITKGTNGKKMAFVISDAALG